MRLKSSRRFHKVVGAGAAVGALAVAGIVPTTTASAASKKPMGSPVVFHAVVSETGSAASLGATEAKAMQALEKEVNSTGGIKGHPMSVTVENNNSTPTTSVALASKLVSQKVPFFFVGSAAATDEPVIALATSSGPFIYDLSPADYPKPTSTVFDAGISTLADAQAYLTFLKAKGLTKVAYINGTTASGKNGFTEFQTALKTTAKKFSGFTLLTHQTFTPTAVSVTTEMTAIKATNPQAIIIWQTGSGVGTVLKAMSGLDMGTIPTVIDNADASYTLLTKLKTVLPKTYYFEGGALYVPPSDLTGKVKSTVSTFDKFVSAAGGHGGDPWGLGYDPGLLVVDALRHLGIHATAKQVTKYLEHLHKVPGVFGYYTTSPATHRGTSYKDIYIDTFNGTSFVPVSGPGGTPTTKSTKK